MNTKYIIIAMLLCSTTINAQFVSSEQAKQKGLEFLNSLSIAKTRGGVSSDQLTLCHTEFEADTKTPTLYVFNSDLTSVVVSADERTCDILGYSDNGISAPENLACSYKALLEMYSEQIIYARKNNLSKYVKTRGSDEDRKEIPPMLTCKWGQYAPYNNKCPIDKNTKELCIAGCVPVAMAQLMYYFKWPDIGTGTHSYFWYKGNEVLSADFGSQPYHMENMKDEYKETDIDDNLSTFIYHCGVAAHAEYSSSETAGFDMGLHFAKFFKYSDNYWNIGNAFTDKETLLSEVYNELSRNHPMMVSLNKASGHGHMAVCDGYKDGRVHYNFGWYGNLDGYYLPNIVNVSAASYIGVSFDMGFIPKNDEIEVDGFRYEIYQDEAYLVSGKPSGDFRVPSEIDYQGKKYWVKSVCHEAFRDSKELASVTIPSSVKVLSDSVFAGCTSFKELIIEDGDEPFYWSWNDQIVGPSEMDKIYIGRDLTGTGLGKINELIIGPKVKQLGYLYISLPYNSSSSKVTILSETPPKIDERTSSNLENCNTPVYIPIGTYEAYKSSEYWKNTNLREMPFEIDGMLFEREDVEGLTLIKGEVNSPELVIPEEVNYNNSTTKVVKIADEAFKDNQTITSVVIPPTVKTIGKYAFYKASELQSVEILDGDSLLIADYDVFSETKLVKAYIGRNWDGNLFSSKYDLKDVTLSDHVTCLPNNAFRFTAIEYIYIPASVEKIGYKAFDYCGNLTDIQISPENNHFTYEDKTLYSKDKRKIIEYLANSVDYVMPNEVIEVCDYAFVNTYLKGLKLSENLESVGIGSFEYSINQDTLYLPKSLKNIAGAAFGGANIDAFDVDNENPYYKSLNGILFNKTGNVLVSTPQRIKNAIILAEGVDTICAGAFEYSKASTVYVPSTIKFLGDGAFRYLKSDSLIMNCNEPPALLNTYGYDNPFYSWDSNSEGRVYVPEGTLSKYQQTSGYYYIRELLRELSTEEMNKWATTDIKKPINDKRYSDTIYDLNGRKVKKPQKGIYILRSSDGSSKKVIY